MYHQNLNVQGVPVVRQRVASASSKLFALFSFGAKILIRRKRATFLIMLLSVIASPALLAMEDLTTNATLNVKVMALMYDGQTIPGTDRKVSASAPTWVEVKTFAPDVARRLLNAKPDSTNSLTTHFWGEQSKEFEIVVDLGRVFTIERIEVQQGEPAGHDNTLSSMRIYGSNRLPDQTWDQSFGLFEAQKASQPPGILADSLNKEARFLKLFILSNAPLSSLGSLKIFGSASQNQENQAASQKRVPNNALRVELGTAGGLSPEKSPEFIGQMATWRDPQLDFEVPSTAPRYELWVLARKPDDVVAEARIHQEKLMVKPVSNGWTKLCSIEPGKTSIEMQTTPANAAMWDELILMPEGSVRPDQCFPDDLSRIPQLKPLKGFAQQLLFDKPDISDDEFADLVAKHYGFPDLPDPLPPVTDLRGNPLWKGKPFFSQTLFHFAANNPVVASSPVNTAWQAPEPSDPRRDYAVIISYHALWKSYDAVAAKLKRIQGAEYPFIHYLCDEPSNVGVSVRELRRLNTLVKRLDPYHPTFINVCPNDVGNPHILGIPDVAGADIYPIPGGRISDIGGSLDRLRVAAAGRPFIFVPQFFSWGGYGRLNARFPTSDEVWAMASIALTRNARGFWFYEWPAPIMSSKTSVADLYPEQWKALGQFMETNASLAPELTGPEVDTQSLHLTTAPPKNLHWRLAVTADQTSAALIVVNSGAQAQIVQIDLRGSPIADARISLISARGCSSLKEKESGVWSCALDAIGTAFLRVSAPGLGQLPLLSPNDVVRRTKEKLKTGGERPEVSLSVHGEGSDFAETFSADLLDSWVSSNRPDTAAICATKDGLVMKVSTRFRKGAESKVLQRDGDVWMDPSIEIFIGTADQPDKYLQLAVNTANCVSDTMVDLSREVSRDPNFTADFTTKVSAGVESADYLGFIPWKTLEKSLGYSKDKTLTLNIASSASNWDWVGLSGTGYHQPEAFGHVVIKK